MTSLLEYAEEHQQRGGQVCLVSQSAHRKDIEDGLRAGIAATVISRWLREEHGEKVSAGSINYHKRQECKCPRA